MARGVVVLFGTNPSPDRGSGLRNTEVRVMDGGIIPPRAQGELPDGGIIPPH